MFTMSLVEWATWLKLNPSNPNYNDRGDKFWSQKLTDKINKITSRKNTRNQNKEPKCKQANKQKWSQ